MAITQLRGSSQIKDATINRSKLVNDFLNGSDWNLTNGANNATITGVMAGSNPYDVVNYEQFQNALSGLDFQKDVIAKQVDNTLDPGASPNNGDRYIITDSSNLHTNFGSIPGIGNNDIVEYTGSVFEVVYDVSVQGEGTLVWEQTGNIYQRWDGTSWDEFGGLSGITAGNGLTKTGNVINVNSANASITVNPDNIEVTAGNTNGNSLEVTATGIELRSTITGDRTFTGANFAIQMTATAEFHGSTTTTIGTSTSNTHLVGNSIDFNDSEVADATVTSAIPFAITPTTNYGNGNGTSSGDAINQFRSEFTDDALINALLELKANVDNNVSKLTAYYNEMPSVTNGSATLPALAHLGSHATDKVINVRVYLNGIRQAQGVSNDYTINQTTGVITFIQPRN